MQRENLTELDVTDLLAAGITVTEQFENYLDAHTAISVNKDEFPNFQSNVSYKAPPPNVNAPE